MNDGRLNLFGRWGACLLACVLGLAPLGASALVTTDGQTATNVNFNYPTLEFDYVDQNGDTQHYSGSALDHMLEPKLRAFIASRPAEHGSHEAIRKLAGVYPSLEGFMSFVKQEQGIWGSCSSQAIQTGTDAQGDPIYQTAPPIWCMSSLSAVVSLSRLTGTLYTDMSGDAPHRCTQDTVSINGSNIKVFIGDSVAGASIETVATRYRVGFTCSLYTGNFSAHLTAVTSGYPNVFGISCVSGGPISGCSSNSIASVMSTFSTSDIPPSNPPDLFAAVNVGLPAGCCGGTPGGDGEGTGGGDTGTGGGDTGGGELCTEPEIAMGYATVSGECRYYYSATCWFDVDFNDHCESDTGTGGGDTGGGDTGTGGGDTGTGGGDTGGGDTGTGGGDTGTGGQGDDQYYQPGDGFGDAAAIEVSEVLIPLFSTGSGWLPRSCPAPQSLTLLGKPHSLSFEPACTGLSYLSFLLLAMAFLKAVGIVFASRQV